MGEIDFHEIGQGGKSHYWEDGHNRRQRLLILPKVYTAMPADQQNLQLTRWHDECHKAEGRQVIRTVTQTPGDPS
jgi:hypothetical protein